MEEPNPAASQQKTSVCRSFLLVECNGSEKVFSKTKRSGINARNPIHCVPNPGAFNPMRIPDEGMAHQALVLKLLDGFMKQSSGSRLQGHLQTIMLLHYLPKLRFSMIDLTPYSIQHPIQVSEDEYDQLVQKKEGGKVNVTKYNKSFDHQKLHRFYSLEASTFCRTTSCRDKQLFL